MQFNRKYSDCDFSGYATRNDLKCADGRTIRHNAFKDQDGAKVPLVWNHDHKSQDKVLGHAFLENRDDGVYAYGYFNDSESGKQAREIVQHGDVESLSIWANDLKQSRIGDVFHGVIRELSLCLAGANKGAYIDYVMAHSAENPDEEWIDSLYANYDERINIVMHSEKEGREEKEMAEDTAKKTEPENRTVQDVVDTMNEEQQKVFYGVIGAIAAEKESDENEDDDVKHSINEGGEDVMKFNAFDQSTPEEIKHSLTSDDKDAILEYAKRTGSLRHAITDFISEDEELSHAIDDVDTLFPEFTNTNGNGAPELIKRDQGWISEVMNKVSKSPYSRIKTRWADIRELKAQNARGYKKGEQKKNMANLKVAMRKVTPTTVYIKDQLDRDDIVDITDFDVVLFQQQIMKELLNEVLALAFLVGDGRDDSDDDKINEENIIPVWKDADLFTIKGDIDIASVKNELQGTNTGANFGDSFIRSEAIIQELLFLREKYKGSGQPDMFIAPHELNVLMLARDMNGRRIRGSITELAAELNVKNIITVEQFAGLERTDENSKKHKLLAIVVNLSDYQVGSTKGGEITSFKDFDIDFNKEKYLIETRLSGALTRFYSAIVLEEPVTEG